MMKRLISWPFSSCRVSNTSRRWQLCCNCLCATAAMARVLHTAHCCRCLSCWAVRIHWLRCTAASCIRCCIKSERIGSYKKGRSKERPLGLAGNKLEFVAQANHVDPWFNINVNLGTTGDSVQGGVGIDVDVTNLAVDHDVVGQHVVGAYLSGPAPGVFHIKVASV